MQPDLRGSLEPPSPEPQCEATRDGDPDAWRHEVAARLARYRTRRKPRAPRYPSLLLPFDSAGHWSRNTAAKFSELVTEPQSADLTEHSGLRPTEPPADDARSQTEAEPSNAPPLPTPSRQHQFVEELNSFANVIEFPRSAAIPIFHDSLLADPIIDRPRIVEAPEILPPPPALGGILIEPPQTELPERRLNTEPSIASASIPHRLFAVSLDVLTLGAALAAGGAIFLHFNPIPPDTIQVNSAPLPLTGIGAIACLLILLWMSYQFIFIVFTGSTPGLRATRLRIAGFDGSPTSRCARRWRVLASFLSAFSAGLGYLWCVLDQDSLCWHDRITRTCIQPADASRTTEQL